MGSRQSAARSYSQSEDFWARGWLGIFRYVQYIATDATYNQSNSCTYYTVPISDMTPALIYSLDSATDWLVLGPPDRLAIHSPRKLATSVGVGSHSL